MSERISQPAAGNINNLFDYNCPEKANVCNELAAYIRLHADVVHRMLEETGMPAAGEIMWQDITVSCYNYLATQKEESETDKICHVWIPKVKNGATTLFPASMRNAILRPISKKSGAFRVQNGKHVVDGFSLDLRSLKMDAPYYTSPLDKLETGMFLPKMDRRTSPAAQNKIAKLVKKHKERDAEGRCPLSEHGTHAGWNIFGFALPEGDDRIPMYIYLLSPQGEFYQLADFDPESTKLDKDGMYKYSQALTPTCSSEGGEWSKWNRAAGEVYDDLTEKSGKLYYLTCEAGSETSSVARFRIIELCRDKMGYKVVCERQVDRGKAPFWDLDRGLIVLPQGGHYIIYRLAEDMTMDMAADLYLQGNHYAIVLPNGHYAGSPGCESILKIEEGGKSYDIAPLAPWRNRPDEVLAAIGGDEAEIEALRSVVQRWLDKQAVDATLPEPKLADLPTLKVEYPDVKTDKDVTQVHFKCAAHAEGVKEIRIWLDGVESAPITADIPAGGSKDFSVDIPLISGCNMVDMCAVDALGRQSMHERFRVVCTAQHQRTLYVVSVGVSDYEDPAYKLNYAAKDAGDIADCFRKMKAKVLLLTDAEVKSGTCTSKIKEFLSAASPDDQVVFYCAGHGVLGDDLEYYFAPHDCDMERLKETGIPMNELVGAVKSSPARKRLMLVDTCHAGAMGEEDEEKIAMQQTTLPSGVRAVQTRGMKIHRVKPMTNQAKRRFIEEAFTTGEAERGITVFTASSGSQYAYESEKWNNGVFAHVILEALMSPEKTDVDGDGKESVSNLGAYLNRRVQEETNGAQTPAVNAYSSEQEFPVRDNVAKVISWLDDEFGNRTAESLLEEGMDNAYGRKGRAKDNFRARELYEAAAARGSAEAMYRLARMHRYKIGNCNDPAQARSWYQKAADLGHTKAKKELKELR